MNKQCKLCEDQTRDFTATGSNNKADVYLIGKYLIFEGDEGVSYKLKCNFCPACGRLLPHTQ